jgi:hypothetical protein
MKLFTFLWMCMICGYFEYFVTGILQNCSKSVVMAIVFFLLFTMNFSIRGDDGSSFYVDFENIYSSSLKSELNLFLRSELKAPFSFSFDIRNLLDSLEKKYPVVKGVEYRVDSTKRHLLKIIGVNPRYMINDGFVIGDSSTLLSKNDFCDFPLNSIDRFYVNEKYCSGVLADKPYRFLINLPRKHSANFIVEYKDSSNILLKPKNEVGLIILADERGLNNFEKVYIVSSIKDDFLYRKRLSFKRLVKNNRNLVFDIRFGKRIFASISNLLKLGRGS